MRDHMEIAQENVDVDAISARILRELSRDGRMANAVLADKVGLSPSACLRRVQDLERRGLIAGYRAVLSERARRVGFVAYVTVGLNLHTKNSQQDFEHAMQACREVRECHNITGAVEYLLRVETRDLADYKRFHTDRLGTLAQVNQITTHVVMGSPKDRE